VYIVRQIYISATEAMRTNIVINDKLMPGRMGKADH